MIWSRLHFLILSFLIGIVPSQKLQDIRTHFGVKQLVIKVNRQSPAFLALEESYLTDVALSLLEKNNLKNENLKVASAVTLSAGEPEFKEISLTPMNFKLGFSQKSRFPHQVASNTKIKNSLKRTAYNNSEEDPSIIEVTPNTPSLVDPFLVQKEGPIKERIALKGSVRFEDGSAHLGEGYELVVFGTDALGHSSEPRKVNLEDGSFSIEVPTNAAQLVARLVHESGRVLSEGITVIEPQADFKNLVIGIKPTQTISGKVTSYYSDSKKHKDLEGELYIEGIDGSVYVNNKGRFQDPDDLMAAGSQMISTYVPDREDYVPTVATSVTAGESLSLVGIPQSMYQSFSGIKEVTSLIWGSVVGLDGLPIKGAKVQVISSNRASDTIYFKGGMVPLPATSEVETGENGMFSVVGAEEGPHWLEVSWIDSATKMKQWLRQMVVVRTSQVSVVNIQAIKQKTGLELLVYNPFSQNKGSLVASVRKEGSPLFESSQNFSLNSGKGWELIEAETEMKGFEISRFFVQRNIKRQTIPVFPSHKLEDLRTKFKISDSVGTGMVFGWLPKTKKWELHEVKNILKTKGVKIFYFTPEGMLIDPSDTENLQYARGFLLTGVPVGLQSFLVKNKNTEQWKSYLSMVEAGAISVLSEYNPKLVKIDQLKKELEEKSS